MGANDDMISAAFYVHSLNLWIKTAHNGHSAMSYGEIRKPSGFVFSIRIP